VALESVVIEPFTLAVTVVISEATPVVFTTVADAATSPTVLVISSEPARTATAIESRRKTELRLFKLLDASFNTLPPRRLRFDCVHAR
jgi:hypothetical protein